DDLQSVVGAAMAVGLLVRITHQSALEASVGDELEAGEPQPIVAFVRLHAGGGNEVLDRGGSSQSPDQKGIAKADGALVAQRLPAPINRHRAQCVPYRSDPHGVHPALRV